MKFIIQSESRGRMRITASQKRMTFEQADTLQYYLMKLEGVSDAKVNENTCGAVICYHSERAALLTALKKFRYEMVELPDGYLASSGRELNAQYRDRLIGNAALHYARRWLLPAPVRACYVIWQSAHFLKKGIKCLWQRKIEVPVLDAAAITVSMLRGDFDTAGSVMFLLGIGDILEDWTHKKSVGDLARSMSLNIDRVWQKTEAGEVLVETSRITAGDQIVVHMGNVIPFDGVVADGEGMVNQASLTGEAIPVRRDAGTYVYAGTVLEEGEITVCVKQVGNCSRYEKIVTMIEESEKLKSGLESRAEHLADRLVPWTLGGTILTYLLTRNITKTVSVLMVDYSCALKMAMPIAVLYAIQEANHYSITVKGGKYLEAVADAETIVFDKTGTLTKATPRVVDVVSFNGEDPKELLRLAACLEEHFPHSMAKAVVDAAQERGLEHEEMHSNVEYVVAHGISSSVEGKKVIIGSHHFIFGDENCTIPDGKQEAFDALPVEYSHLYMAIDGQLAAVICIEDPLRQEAAEVVKALRHEGFRKIVMMTGDSDRTARAIAAKVGVDEYYSEVLPEDKAKFVEQEKASGRKVIMIGDGINDSPALSAADAGIAISDGAAIAREIADITIGADDLHQILVLRRLSKALMKRIRGNYRKIVSFNSALILLGVMGVIQPTTSALLHNTSTILISMGGMRKLLPEE